MAFNKGDVVVLQTGKLKQFFRVQRDAGKDSTQAEDIFGVWAPAGGSVYVPTSKVKKVSPSDIRMRRVYVDVISPSVKDWQHRAEVARSIKRDIQGIGVMDFVPTREADLEFNCPTALAEDVKKMLHPTHFKVEVNSSKSTDKVVANALAYACRTARNDRVTEIDGVPYKPFKKGDKVVDRKGRKGTVTGFGIGGSRLNFVVRFATGEEEMFAGDMRHA